MTAILSQAHYNQQELNSHVTSTTILAVNMFTREASKSYLFHFDSGADLDTSTRFLFVLSGQATIETIQKECQAQLGA